MTRTFLSTIMTSMLLLQAAVANDAVRFMAYDLEIDSGAHELAVWQIEVTYDKTVVAIVGIEGGDEEPFSADKPPYYDSKGMTGGRIILANFSKAKKLRGGKQKVARLHIQVTGDERPTLAVTVMAAADKAGKKIATQAKAVFDPPKKTAKAVTTDEKMPYGHDVIRKRMTEVKVRNLITVGENFLKGKSPNYPEAIRTLVEADKIYAESKITSPDFVVARKRLRKRIATVHLAYAEILIKAGEGEESIEKLRKAESLIEKAFKYDTYQAPTIQKTQKRINAIKNQLPYEIEVE